MNIKEFYGDKRAKRSNVPLMNHITEGLRILDNIGASNSAKRAYEIHPIYQDDNNLYENLQHLQQEPPLVIIYVMEYRKTANACLSSQVYIDYSQDWHPLRLKQSIQLSPLEDVNKMLVADKVQNYKDFLKYHKDTHERSKELDFYFNSWFKALGVTYENVLYFC